MGEVKPELQAIDLAGDTMSQQHAGHTNARIITIVDAVIFQKNDAETVWTPVKSCYLFRAIREMLRAIFDRDSNQDFGETGLCGLVLMQR